MLRKVIYTLIRIPLTFSLATIRRHAFPLCTSNAQPRTSKGGNDICMSNLFRWVGYCKSGKTYNYTRIIQYTSSDHWAHTFDKLLRDSSSTVTPSSIHSPKLLIDLFINISIFSEAVQCFVSNMVIYNVVFGFLIVSMPYYLGSFMFHVAGFLMPSAGRFGRER